MRAWMEKRTAMDVAKKELIARNARVEKELRRVKFALHENAQKSYGENEDLELLRSIVVELREIKATLRARR